MDLDNRNEIRAIDASDMLGSIDRLPDQLAEAWQSGQSFPLPDALRNAKRIVIAGMGGSAIGGTILAAFAASRCDIPIVVWRDYGLPGWARGPETLILASSHSGNTEETLSAYAAARERECRILALTTGGKLAAQAAADGVPVWKFVYPGQPRSAVGYTFALPLAVTARLGFLPDPAAEIRSAVEAMRTQQETVGAEVPQAKNPAKRLALKCAGKSVIVLGSDCLAPVARRWKGQFSEVAKAWAQFEELPELDHNTVAGTVQPKEIIERSIAIFLRSSFDHPRNSLRAGITRELFTGNGWTTEEIIAGGDTPLAQIFTCLHFGDYASLYTACAYQIDPTPVAVIENLKKRLAA